MKRLLLLVLALSCLPALAQESGPKIYIDSESYGRTQGIDGLGGNMSLLSAPEIADRVNRRCQPCRITIKKDAADYVLSLSASQAQDGSGRRYSWALYENKEGLMIRKGDTVLLDNTVKDAIGVMLAHWEKKDLPATVTDTTDAAPAIVYVYRSEGAMKSMANPIISLNGKDIARLTKGRFFALKLSPGAHSLECNRGGIKAESPLDVSVAPGFVYYVKYSSGKIMRPNMKLVKAEDAAKDMKDVEPEERKNLFLEGILSEPPSFTAVK